MSVYNLIFDAFDWLIDHLPGWASFLIIITIGYLAGCAILFIPVFLIAFAIGIFP